MSTSPNIRGRIDIDAGPAAKALGLVADNFARVATNARTTDGQLTKATAGMKAAQTAAAAEAKGLVALAAAQEKVNLAYQKARLVSAKATGVNVATKNTKAVTEGKVNLYNARADAEAIKAKSYAEEKALKGQIALRDENVRAQKRINAEQERGFTQLASTRYALYDVSRTLGIAGAAMLALPAASLSVAVAWERDFARVERTFGGTTGEIAKLKTEFLTLVQTIPEDWGALTEIGTLAGQLGIPGQQVASFTKIVAQFATTTGVSVDQTATAFGRLNSLVPGVDGNYQKLADSVLKVGVNSVATEFQILKIATQLSFLGSQTTFTAEEIIGLSGALASVGVPPELSRGVVARVFGTISRAVSDSGKKMEGFAKIAGVSANEFKAGWSNDTGATFIKFMQGIRREGTNAEAAIRALGITSIRDVPVLIRLANAADSAGRAGKLITQTFRDATEEISRGELARQYDIQAGTISAKTELLINNFQALLAVGGSGGLGPLGDLLDALTNRLKDITKFAQSDVGGRIIGFGLIFAAFAGALLLAGAAAATGLAGYMALILALKGLQTAGGGAVVSMASLNGLLIATGPLGVKAAAGIRAIGAAMRALYGLGIALVLPDISKWAGDTMYDLLNVDKTFDSTLKRFKGSQAFKVAIDDDFTRGVREASETLGIFAYDGQRDLNRLQESFQELAATGNIEALKTQLTEFSNATGWSFARMQKEMPGLKESFDEAGLSVQQFGKGTFVVTDAATGMSAAGGTMSEALEEVEAAAEATATAIKEAADALMAFNGTAIGAEEAEIKFQTQLNSIRDAAKEADVSITGTNDASLKFRSSLIEGEKAARDSAKAILDNNGSIDQANQKYADMRAAIVKEVAAKTGSIDKANEWADRILGTSDEAKAAIQNYSDKVNQMPTLKNLTVNSNITSVRGGVDGLLSALSILTNRTYKVKVDVQGIAKATGAARGAVGAAYPNGFSGGQFYQGGFTGLGGKYQPAGVVHKGEYVMPAYSVQALGTGYFDNLRRATQKGYSSGGAVSAARQVTPAATYGGTLGAASARLATIDAQSIAAIANALANVNLALYTTDRKIAEAASRGATEQTLIGKK